MRIKYNIKNGNSFKVFNDSMGVALNRENIIRGKKVKYLSYLTISFQAKLKSYLWFLKT